MQNLDTQTTPTAKTTYKIGTLEYTKRSLTIVFFWLLWGDFCFNIMEKVFPNIVPLTMNQLNSPGWLIGLVCTTIPAVLNFFVCPWVSYKSDRHRGKWGRRIPFLLFPTPWIAAILVMMGFSRQIGEYLHTTTFHGSHFSQTTIILGVIAVLATSFQYFNMFVASVYYYLFNDVVPDQFLGRFMALFRVVGSLAGAAFQFFVFQYAKTHYVTWIWIGAGILYFIVFTLMCLNIKEGEYPPPPENVDGKVGFTSSLKTFFIECYSHKFYWVFFLASTSYAIYGSLSPFEILLQTDSLGISTKNIGLFNGTAMLIGAALLYPMGMFSDKKHPVRITLWALGGLVILTPIRFIYLFLNVTPSQAYHIEFAWAMITLPVSTMYSASSLPLFMRMLPIERYGQFCSAEAMLRSLVIIVTGVSIGGILDLLKSVSIAHGLSPVFHFRYVPVMMWVAQIAAFLLMIRVYKYFKEFGGDKNYKPPQVGKL